MPDTQARIERTRAITALERRKRTNDMRFAGEREAYRQGG